MNNTNLILGAILLGAFFLRRPVSRLSNLDYNITGIRFGRFTLTSLPYTLSVQFSNPTPVPIPVQLLTGQIYVGNVLLSNVSASGINIDPGLSTVEIPGTISAISVAQQAVLSLGSGGGLPRSVDFIGQITVAGLSQSINKNIATI